MESLVIVIVVLAAMGVLVWWMRGNVESQAAAMRQEMQVTLHAQIQAQTQAMTGQLTQVVQQLGLVNQALQSGLSSSGTLVAKAQENLATELKHSREAVSQIRQELGSLQQLGQELSRTSQTMQDVLGGAKSRGMLGEVALEGLLADALPAAQFDTQYRFSTGSIVDAVVHIGEKIVPVDSKFPLDAYRRLSESGDARKEFARAVRNHADSIASKYILPAEGTLDFAMMFVPSESVYYELLMTEDSKGRLDEYCVGVHVVPVSPNTLYAYLNVIRLGLRGMQVEENARRLMDNLGGLQKQLEAVGETYDKLGGHLRNAQRVYDEVQSKLERARLDTEQMAQGALPEAAPAKALEPATHE